MCRLESMTNMQVYVYSTTGMSTLFHKGLMQLQVSIPTKQKYNGPGRFNQLISVFRKLIGRNVCSWTVRTKACRHMTLNGIVWICMVYSIEFEISTHGSVVYPLTVTVLQVSSQFSGQLSLIHIAVQIRQRVQHHNLRTHPTFFVVIFVPWKNSQNTS